MMLVVPTVVSCIAVMVKKKVVAKGAVKKVVALVEEKSKKRS